MATSKEKQVARMAEKMARKTWETYKKSGKDSDFKAYAPWGRKHDETRHHIHKIKAEDLPF